MRKTAVVTDSNSGITQNSASAMGITVIPMPFTINGRLFQEDINLTQEKFYEMLSGGAEISTSQPSISDITECWDKLLNDYDEIVHIPMSSGLSSSCQTALMLSADFNGRVHVVNNHRISVTQKQSVFDALKMAQNGANGLLIKQELEKTAFDASIYITLETLIDNLVLIILLYSKYEKYIIKVFNIAKIDKNIFKFFISFLIKNLKILLASILSLKYKAAIIENTINEITNNIKKLHIIISVIIV